jgi:phosphoglycolate phosphatase-like HAD superfamily hydrolase
MYGFISLLCYLLFPSVITAAFTLITFDVDGTLVAGSGAKADASAHARAFGVAVGKQFGNGSPTDPVAQLLPRRDYHGSTDGLILCRLAKAAFGVAQVSADEVTNMMDTMFDYISSLSDEEIAEGITPLPGVIDTLSVLAIMKDRVACGLVTGNVEGIARRKMRAVGIFQTNALAPPSDSQTRVWKNSQDIAFLGGFGSDYCSRNILDADRNFLDRGEQIAIAAKRCSHPNLTRVVHVGDAPADILAAKAYSEVANVCVGCVGVATGSYSAQELKQLAGDPVPGKWEPVILEDGLAFFSFLNACGFE